MVYIFCIYCYFNYVILFTLLQQKKKLLNEIKMNTGDRHYYLYGFIFVKYHFLIFPIIFITMTS